ncbi:MAG: hypothetical protein ACD_3C00206G0007 [uncultured bacterium (gcode 4)]|uniref:LTD domain-containing protein n=1 Tax=uncultured bacterium (gcode 4) TaxID=1234023 RepID=K2GVS4_9BACT|nr:MAG: hypothetical protein ACD_3C00206G0007 [uncultured bacterium (gcode 4)]
MKLRYFFWFAIFFCSYVAIVFAQGLMISSVFPNTDDDANMEYIEIYNSTSEPFALSWYYLKDKSEKTFTYWENIILQPWEARKIYRSESKIILNNSDEEIWLYDSFWNVADSFSYSTSIKNLPISTMHQLPVIEVPPVIIENTGATATWTEIPPIIEIPPVIIGNTGTTATWADSLPPVNNLTWAILSDSGTIMNSWSEIIKQLEALNLYYSDSDFNWKVDNLEIEFNQAITGALVLENFKIYSNSWGLSLSRIDLSSELITENHMSWSSIFLTLLEQDNFKPTLNINNSTSSDLRIKTSPWAGIFDLWWNEMRAITLTASFSNYRNVFKRENMAWLVQTGAILDLSWQTAPSAWWDSGSSQTSLIIPDIFITLQQPSYIIKSEDGDVYFCDNIHEDCRANFSLEASFSWAYGNLNCSMSIWTGDISETCNPSAIIFWTWTTEIEFKIFEKLYPLNFKSKKITISNMPQVIVVPTPIISIQSWLDSENVCNKAECSVNFNWKTSFEGNESKYVCLWDFWWWVFAEWNQLSCNPNYIKYRPWTYLIILRISEKWNENNYKEKYFKLKNNYIFWNPVASAGETVNSWSIFKIRLEWVTDSEFKKLEGNVLHCSSYDFCSLNFNVENAFSWTIRGKLTYLWDFGNSITSDKRNPPTIKYSSWSYQIKLVVTDILWNKQEDFFYVEFQPRIKEKKAKKEAEPKDAAKDEFKEFSNLLKEMLEVTKEELEVEKLLDKLLARTQKEIDFIGNFQLKLQWKKSKNLYFKKSDSIDCKTRKECSINLWLETSKIDWFKYLWNFGNWLTFTWANPKTINYAPWRYLATLSISDENDIAILKKAIHIHVSKIPPAKKKLKAKKKKAAKKQKALIVSEKKYKIIPSSFFGSFGKEKAYASFMVILSITILFIYLKRKL